MSKPKAAKPAVKAKQVSKPKPETKAEAIERGVVERGKAIEVDPN